MNFGEALTAHAQLRKRLAVYFGADGLPDITIDPPRGTSDELSFLRMVAWAYVLRFETGRVSLDYLRQLPPWNQPASALLPYVRSLRTWTSHNLALEKEGDRVTLRDAIAWFTRTCGVGTPATQDHWRQCFSALCSDVVTVLNGAISACDAFEKPDDHDRLVDGLRKRLDRDWAAFRFDSVVKEAASRLGYRGIDAVKFRTRQLDAWRKLVATCIEDDLERNLRLRVEADMLSMMNGALPLTADELEALTGVFDKQAVLAMLLSLRAIPPELRNGVIEIMRVDQAEPSPSLKAVVPHREEHKT